MEAAEAKVHRGCAQCNYREIGLGTSHHISTTTHPFDLFPLDISDRFHVIASNPVRLLDFELLLFISACTLGNIQLFSGFSACCRIY